MERNKILQEIELWNRIAESNDIDSPEIIEINQEIKKIEIRMLKYFIQKYDSPKLIESLKAKKIIDDNGKLIDNNGLFLTQRTLNFGYSSSSYYLNPKSAMMLYSSYLDFSNGIINENIRQDLDYKNISDKDLYKLNSYEIIYWCYIHDITFLDFAKANFIHECSHRFGIAGGDEPDDPYLFNVLTEGTTEIIAREFAQENGLFYIPIFRKTEIEFVRHFFEGDMEELKKMSLTWDKTYHVIYVALFYLFNIYENDDLTLIEKYRIIEKVLGEKQDVERLRRNIGASISQTDSFITIFDKIALREKTEKLIETTESVINEQQLKL